MKKNDFAKLKNQTAAELSKMLAESREKLVKLTRDIAANKIKNVRSAGALRKDIARIMTLLRTKATSDK